MENVYYLCDGGYKATMTFGFSTKHTGGVFFSMIDFMTSVRHVMIAYIDS